MGATTVREVILKLRMQMDNQRIKLPAPDTSAFSNSLAKARDEFQAQYVNLDRQAAAARSQFEMNHPGGKRSPTENGTNSEIVGKLRIAGDAYKVAGEGALHFARGLAFLNAQSEEDLQKVIRQIAHYQGLYDLYRGGWDVIKGTVVGIKAQAAAHTAAAAATAAHSRFAVGHAAALTTSTVVMNATTTAATRMWAALIGPIGWAALAAGVAYGAVQWGRYRQAVEDAAIEQHRLLKEHATLATMAKGRQDDLNRSMELGKQFAERAGLYSQLHGLDMSTIGNISQAPLNATADEQRRFDLAAQSKTMQEKLQMNAGLLEKQKLSFANHLQAARANTQAGDSVENLQQRKVEAAMALNSLRAQNETRKEALALRTEERRQLEGLIGLERQRFNANKAALKEEQNRRMTLIEKLGALEPHQQQQLKDVATQVEKGGYGSLRRDQRQFLDNTGLADAAKGDFERQRGEALLKDQDIFKQLQTFRSKPQDLVEGQGKDQSKEDFFRQQMSEITRSKLKADEDLITIMKEQDRLKEELKQKLVEAMDWDPFLRELDKAISDRQAKIEAWMAKQQAKTDQISNGITTTQLSRNF